MGATEEQMAYLSGLHVTHVSYILILFSFAFLLCLFVSLLLHMYAQHKWPIRKSATDRERGGAVALPQSPSTPEATAGGRANGSVGGLGRTVVAQRDAQEFELEGLISEDEEGRVGSEPSEDSGTGRRKEATV